MGEGSGGTVTADEFLARLAQLRTHEHEGQRAPHKPLLLLFALGRVLRERDRLVSYVEVDRQVGQLMRSFGSPRSAVRPHYPFRWLFSDGGLYTSLDFRYGAWNHELRFSRNFSMHRRNQLKSRIA